MPRLSLLVLCALPLAGYAAETARPATVVKPTPSVSSESGYELRGFFGAGADVSVSLLKIGSETSAWVAVGETAGGVTVESADPKTGQAVLRIGPRRVTLRLTGEAAPVAAAPAAESAPAAKSARPFPDAARRKVLLERMQKMGERMSPEQIMAGSTAVKDKVNALAKSHPAILNGQPKNQAEAEEEAKLMMPILREYMEAAIKLSDKNGEMMTMPEDFEEMLLADAARSLPDEPAPAPATH